MPGAGVGAPRATLDLAIVIPALDESATIQDLVRRSTAVAGRVFVIDDGSADGTGDLAEAAGAVVLRQPATLGKGAALRRGLVRALAGGATAAVTLDGDGQHRPEDVARLAAAAMAWPGRIVIGSRRSAQASMPPARWRANRIADFWVGWAARQPIDDSQSGMRLYPAEVLARLDLERPRQGGFVFESELLIDAGRLGVRTAAVPIAALYGSVLQRPSHFRPAADITRIVLMVAGKLLRWGMDPLGLWRSLQRPDEGAANADQAVAATARVR